MGDLLTVNEICKKMKFSRATLYRYIEEGIPHTIIGTKKKMFDPDQVADFLASRKDFDISLNVGKEYTNKEICDMLRVGVMGGIRKSNTKNALVVISYPYNLRFKYHDYWDNDILYYYGQGATGNQSIETGYNRALMESKQYGYTIYLFESFAEGRYKYRGISELAGDVALESVEDYNEDRVVMKFPLRLLNQNKYLSEEFIEQEENGAEAELSKMTKQEIAETAEKIKTPIVIRQVVTRKVQRNPYVWEYARMRANGICELCGQKAPFKVSGRPYLQIDHIIPLFQDGTDSIDNIACLCPNCNCKKAYSYAEEDITKIRHNIAKNEKRLQKELHGTQD